MRTTLDLNEKLIRELMHVTAAKTKTKAIHQEVGSAESLSGPIHLDLDWKGLEQVEIRRQVAVTRRDMVISDTSVWIPLFNRPDSSEKFSLDMLIDADEVALVGSESIFSSGS